MKDISEALTESTKLLNLNRCMSTEKLGPFIRAFSDLLHGPPQNHPALTNFVNRYAKKRKGDDLKNVVGKIREATKSIKTAVVGCTDSGYLLHLLSDRDFPTDLFYEKDEGTYKIHKSRGRYYIAIDGAEKPRFYFSPPANLERAFRAGKEKAMWTKIETLSSISIVIVDRGMLRHLRLSLNKDWARKSIRILKASSTP